MAAVPPRHANAGSILALAMILASETKTILLTQRKKINQYQINHMV